MDEIPSMIIQIAFFFMKIKNEGKKSDISPLNTRENP